MDSVGGIPNNENPFQTRYLNITSQLKKIETPSNIDTWVTCSKEFDKNYYLRQYQPVAQMSHPEMAQINKEIQMSSESAIRQFFSGNISEEDFISKFRELTEKNLEANHEFINYGLTSKNMEQTMLETFYGEFRRTILTVAVRMNNEEGRQYVTGDSSCEGWKYYNSDYYYKSEAALGAITEAMTNLALDRGHESFEIPDYKEKKSWLYYNFNTALSNPMVVTEQTFLDSDAIPPEGLVWFYQQGKTDCDYVIAEPVEEGISKMPAQYDPANFLTATSWATLRGPDGKTHKVSSDIIYDYSKSDRYTVGELYRFDGASQQARSANSFLAQLQVYRRGYFSDQYSNYRFEIRT